MALDQNAVEQQIQHMISFIDQEANEKVDEINTKADEEFEIEKSRIVREKREKIQSRIKKSKSQLEQKKKVEVSQMINKSRLNVLKHRETQIDSVMEEARLKLMQVRDDAAGYKKLMLNLLVQGLYSLLEPQVIVQCREDDKDLVQELLSDAVAMYEKATGMKCQVTVYGRYIDVCGGVVMMNKHKNIRVNNTLDARLNMVHEQMKPEIRVMLFGRNPNRKFLD